MSVKSFRARIAAGFAVSRAIRPPEVSAEKKSPGISIEGDAGWRPLAGGRYSQYYSGSDVDWQKQAGPLWDNGAVAICLAYVLKKLVEPRAEIVTEQGNGEEEAAKANQHPLLDLLKNPNPEYSGNVLRQATAISFLLQGESYWVKARGMNGIGAVKELWYVPYWEMEPLPPKDGGPTQVFKRVVGGSGGKTEFYTRDDVIHFKFAMDPRNPRRGWSPFRSMFCEIVTDREVATFTATILRNLGVIGYMITPESDKDELGDGVAQELKRKFGAAATGDNRAEVVVADAPLKVSKVGYSPQELAIGDMGDRPEARIAAAFGLNTMAVNLPSGRKAQVYKNLKEARAASWEDCIIPMLTLFAETITEELLPEMDGSANEVFQYCYDKVRDLMPDLAAEADRARKNFAVGIWKLSESRRATGAEVKEDDLDGFQWQLVKPAAKPTATGDSADPTDPDDPTGENAVGASANDPDKDPPE